MKNTTPKYRIFLCRCLLSCLFCTGVLEAREPKEIVKELSLVPASKASVQWERIFKNERKMKKYRLNSLTEDEKENLKQYLISHAADSDLPQYAGEV